MCGILVSRGGRGNDRFIKRRGQDAVGIVERDGLRFAHYLLHVTGEPTPQPFVDGDVVAEGRIEKTQPLVFSADETADVGMDNATPVTKDYKKNDNEFTGKISKVTVELK